MGRVRESEIYTSGESKDSRRTKRKPFSRARPDWQEPQPGAAQKRIREENKRAAIEKPDLGRIPSLGRGSEASGGVRAP